MSDCKPICDCNPSSQKLSSHCQLIRHEVYSHMTFSSENAGLRLGLTPAPAPECTVQFPLPTASFNNDGDMMMMRDVGTGTKALPHLSDDIFGQGNSDLGFNLDFMQDRGSGQAQHSQCQFQRHPGPAASLSLQSMHGIDMCMEAPHFPNNILKQGGFI